MTTTYSPSTNYRHVVLHQARKTLNMTQRPQVVLSPQMASMPRWGELSRMTRSALSNISAGLRSLNEKPSTAVDLEAGCVAWIIRCLRRYRYNVQIYIYSDHTSLEEIGKLGEHKPCVQCWL